jgi:hypothetical protein
MATTITQYVLTGLQGPDDTADIKTSSGNPSYSTSILQYTLSFYGQGTPDTPGPTDDFINVMAYSGSGSVTQSVTRFGSTNIGGVGGQ